MFELTVQHEFCAAHALVIAGEREPVHGHNWRVRAVVAGPSLDENGLLCDFHMVHAVLDGILAPLQNADLNRTPPFDEVNPTAEHIARHIGLALDATLPSGVRVRRLGVTEAPGCEATWIADG